MNCQCKQPIETDADGYCLTCRRRVVTRARERRERVRLTFSLVVGALTFHRPSALWLWLKLTHPIRLRRHRRKARP